MSPQPAWSDAGYMLERVVSPLLNDVCPAGGPHRWEEWTADLDGPGLRGHGRRCSECGASPKDAER